MTPAEPRSPIMAEVLKRLLAKSARVAIREVLWLLGCIAAATLFCFIAPEYGYDPVPFSAGCFYLLIGVPRFFIFWLRRRNLIR